MSLILKAFYILLLVGLVGGGFFLLNWNIPAPKDLIIKPIVLQNTKP
jgi:Na+/H+ antiporter NhaC